MPKKSQKALKEKMSSVVSALEARYPVSECALEYDGEAWKLLVMGRLSAQCTDARVNIVCRELFLKYPDAHSMAEADITELEEAVRPCGLFKTKAAQLKLVKNIAPALAPYGVTVNNVAPGAIDTPRNASVTENDALRRAVEAKIPCGRFGRPEEIAPVVLLLCSEEGAYMTGSDIVIDGGLSLK